MKDRVLLLVALFSLLTSGAQAAQRPDLLSLGAGTFDLFHHRSFSDDLDIRLEHRWGYALYASPQGSFQIRPFAGVEGTPRLSLYGFGGFVFDWIIDEHWVVSPNLAAGLYHEGRGKDLAGILEFRSAMEVGYRFDNDIRLTAYFSHISNAELASRNPGSEMVGLYVHFPFQLPTHP